MTAKHAKPLVKQTGVELMDAWNGNRPVGNMAVMGHLLDDGTYQFIIEQDGNVVSVTLKEEPQ